MESFIIQPTRNTLLPKFSLPSYVSFIENMRAGQHAGFNVSERLTAHGEQIHTLFVNSGLLIFVPTEADPSYVNAPIDSALPDERKSELKQIQRTKKYAATFGSFKEYQLVTWTEGAKELLSTLAQDATAFINALNMTFKGSKRPSKELRTTCMRADTFEIKKQLNFITAGLLLKNDKKMPPIEFYQHFVARMPAEILCKGAAYRGSDVVEYNAVRPKQMYEEGSITLGTGNAEAIFAYVVRVREFNLLDDVWLQTGCAIMITSGPRSGATGNVRMESVRAREAEKLTFSLDDDSDSSEDTYVK